MQDEWIRIGLLVGAVVVMLLVLRMPKKGQNPSDKKEE